MGKFCVNICTFGAWYFYDIFNLFFREDQVVTGGLYNPPLFWSARTAAGDFVPTAGTPAAPQTLWERFKSFLLSLISITDIATGILSVAPSPIPEVVRAGNEAIKTAVHTATAIAEVAESSGRILQHAADMGPALAGDVSNRIAHMATDVIPPSTQHLMHGGRGAVVDDSIGTQGVIVLALLTVLAVAGIYNGVNLLLDGEDKPVRRSPTRGDKDEQTIQKLQTQTTSVIPL